MAVHVHASPASAGASLASATLICSYFVGDRSGQSAIAMMDDLRSRLANRVQLTRDGHKASLEAAEGAFGGDVDYAQLVKLYGLLRGDQDENGSCGCDVGGPEAARRRSDTISGRLWASGPFGGGGSALMSPQAGGRVACRADTSPTVR